MGIGAQVYIETIGTFKENLGNGESFILYGVVLFVVVEGGKEVHRVIYQTRYLEEAQKIKEEIKRQISEC